MLPLPLARLATITIAVALALAAFAPGEALAQRSPKERAALARDAYDAGKKHYNLGEFDEAIELWRQGYEYKDDPIFLYNIAQAYRQKGDHQKAIFFYRAYLREEPRARNREDVEERIAELNRLLESQESPEPPKEPVTPPEPAPEPPPQPPVAVEPEPQAPPADRDASAAPGRDLRIAGLVTGGAGIAALATGIAFMLRSASIEGEIEDAAASGEPWSAALVDRESAGRTSNVIGWTGVGLGAALVTTGVTLYLLGHGKDARARRERSLTLGPIPARALAGLSLSLEF